MYGNTLGMALVCSGGYSEAVTVFKANLSLGKGRYDAWDLFPLAICQYRLGDTRAARENYDKAVAWVRRQGTSFVGDPQDLAVLWAEARQVLGLSE